MSDDHGPAPRWSVPSWRRIGDFVLTIAQLERSYQSLKADVEKLNERLSIIEEKLTDQGGQLKILAGFVQGTLERQIEEKTREATRQIEAKAKDAARELEVNAEQAVARHVDKLIAQRSDPPADKR